MYVWIKVDKSIFDYLVSVAVRLVRCQLPHHLPWMIKGASPQLL